MRVGYSLGVKMRWVLPREPHIVKNCGVVGAADRNSHGFKVGRSGMETNGRSKYGMKVGTFGVRGWRSIRRMIYLDTIVDLAKRALLIMHLEHLHNHP